MTEFAFLLAADITQVIDSIAWVRCASGNVVKYWPPGADTLTVFQIWPIGGATCIVCKLVHLVAQLRLPSGLPTSEMLTGRQS